VTAWIFWWLGGGLGQKIQAVTNYYLFMNWLYLVIIAEFISAIVFMVDKYLVASKAVGRPVVYAFYVGILSIVVLGVLPFGLVSIPSLDIILLSAAVAITFVSSTIFLYSSLQTADASDVAPVMGAVTAMSTLGFSVWLLNTGLPHNFLISFALLMSGTFLMSAFRFDAKATFLVIFGGILFGLSSVCLKMIFNETSFWNGFFWSRIANVAGVLALLIWPANLRAIINNAKTSKARVKYLVVGNKALAGFAFLLTLAAIKFGDVSVINALDGLHFVFLLILAFILTYALPNFFHEAVHRRHNRLKKITASALIIAGFILMFI